MRRKWPKNDVLVPTPYNDVSTLWSPLIPRPPNAIFAKSKFVIVSTHLTKFDTIKAATGGQVRSGPNLKGVGPIGMVRHQKVVSTAEVRS